MREFVAIALFIAGLQCSAHNPVDSLQDNTMDTVQYWKIKGQSTLTLNQIAFSNWAKGGDNSLSGKAGFVFTSDYNKGNRLFQSKVNLAYGTNWTETNHFRKTEDRLNLSAMYGYRAYEKWYYSALFELKTQFDKGYKYPDDSTIISQFFAPAYVTTSLGMEIKPVEYFSVFMSPASGKFTFVLNQELADKGSFGVKPAVVDPETGEILEEGKHIKSEFGINFVLNLKKQLFKNININSVFNLYNNYLDDNLLNRWNMDIDWETNLDFTINEHVATNLYVHMIYDHDVKIPEYEVIDGKKTKVGEYGPRLQLQESFGIGVSLKF